MSTITPLPNPPSTTDPVNFDDRADAFVGQLPTFVTETNIVATEVLTNRNTTDVNVTLTETAKNEALAASITAQGEAPKWETSNTYLQGAVVWSPINFLTYRKITGDTITPTTGGTIDPSNNPAIWLPISSYIPHFVLINLGVI